MKISIITPSYNQGEYIEKTITSVLNQDYDEWEHIIIDGGSTDNTLDILRKYSHLIWTSQKDGGQSEALNKGFQLATGDIIGWLNSDDYYNPNIFHLIYEVFANNPDCIILYGDISFVDENGLLLFEVSGDNLSLDNIRNNPDIMRQPSIFWRKSLLKDIGFIDESFSLVMDLDFYFRALKKHKLHYAAKNFSNYRVYANTKTLKYQRKQVKEIIIVYKKNKLTINRSLGKMLLSRYLNSFNIYVKTKRIFSNAK